MAEEVVQPAGPQSRRMLAVFEVQETEDLACSLSRMFAAGSEWREKLTEARCYVRYAVVPSIADRRAAAGALKTWLNSHREVAAQVFEHKVVTAATTVNAGEMRSERRNARAEHEGGVPSKPAVGLMGCDGGAAQRCGALEETELKTVAETAVDRVTHGIQWSRQSAVEV